MAPKTDLPTLARKLWLPMLLMGLGAVVGGVVAGVVQATLDDPLEFAQVGAWKPGLVFLGIGLLLSAITLLLVRILGELLAGGRRLQVSLGEEALMITPPWTRRIFPVAMMMGLATLIFTFAFGFVQAAKLDTDPAGAADIGAWLAPLRFAGPALIFTAIAFALLTIVKVLRFQADRITQIVERRRG